MIREKSPFSARDPLSGYLFQCSYSLLESLRRLKDRKVFNISIETRDDIVFEDDDDSETLLQIKHTVKEYANFTDASTDIWKTIRIWFHEISTNNLSLDSNFFLITSGKVPEGCAAFYLKRNEKRDVLEAINRLTNTANTSKNKDHKEIYKKFKDMPQEQKIKLFNNIIVIDAIPTLPNLDSEICREVSTAAKEHLIDSFRIRLEGWWFTRIIKHLSDEKDIISSQEIRAKVDILREQFKEDNLPVDQDILDFDVQKSVYKDYAFLKQLELINISNRRIFYAVRNYYRAFQHRSRWLREGFIAPEELDRYEDQLIEEWEICFERMKEKIGEKTAEEEKLNYAKALYEWAETEIIIPLRPGITEPFVTRGSYQMLSDEKRVGWYPEFKYLLQNLVMAETINE